MKQCLHAVTWIRFKDAKFRVVSLGLQTGGDFQVADARKPELRRPGTFHVILQLHGGGSENGTKNGHRTQVKNALAATLLEEGHDLTWTSKTVDNLTNEIRQKELAKILQVQHSMTYQPVPLLSNATMWFPRSILPRPHKLRVCKT